MNVPRLNTDQLNRFDPLYEECNGLDPEPRRARLREIAAGDPDLATVLRAALGEPPSFRGLKHDDVIGKCTLVELLGTGGCGEVWLAQQPLNHGKTSRDVARRHDFTLTLGNRTEGGFEAVLAGEVRQGESTEKSGSA